jgi:type II secretory pathway pseudopilin PulG
MRRHSTRERCRQSGFTLVEVVLSAGLLGFLAVTANFFWVNGFVLVSTVNADSAALSEGRLALERVAREIREIKFDTVQGAYCVSKMDPTWMVFNKTAGSFVASCGGASPSSASNDIAVNIQLPTGSSTLNVGYAGALASPATTRVVTGYASSFGIRYLDASYAVTASASALRYVELSLTVRPAGGQATQTRTVVALRNN